jgi:hypothetical protein
MPKRSNLAVRADPSLRGGMRRNAADAEPAADHDAAGVHVLAQHLLCGGLLPETR